jgi:hypothetical protein
VGRHKTYMGMPEYKLMIKSIDFVGKISTMGGKRIIIIPSEYHKDADKLLNTFMKFHGEEILESKR